MKNHKRTIAHAVPRVALLLIIASGFTISASNPIHFHDYRQDYALPLNQTAVAVATADLNQDGIGDVLSVVPNGVGVLLSEKGTANYSKIVVYPAGNEPVAIAVGDFNGDGHADVVTANNGGNDVTILFGTGTGTLGAPVHISAGSGPSAVIAADFNHDGKLDLAVADFSGNQVTVLLGKGDGTFQAPTRFSAGSSPTAMTLGDFNRDADADLAVVSQNGVVTALLGNGKGSFTATAGAATGATASYSITSADFNGDGILDVAVAEYQISQTGSLYVALGKGDGTFESPTRIALPQYAPAVTSGDVNGDGHADLIAVLSNQNQTFINGLAVLINNGSGIFEAPHLYGSPETPISLAAVDVNRDGKLDLLVGCLPDVYSGQAYVSVILGRGTGSLAEVQEQSSPGAYSVAAGDVNGDGNIDIVAANATNITVFLGNGKGVFEAQTPIPMSGELFYVAIADVNGDGKPDIITVVNEANVAILLGNGHGAFSNPKTYTGLLSTGFVVGDLNGDGYADVVLSGALVSGVQVLWGSATGALTQGPFLSTQFPSQSSQAVAIGDFNGDGKADVAVSTFGSNAEQYVEVFPGAGHNTFEADVKTAVPVLGSIVAADMNGDGITDLVLSGVEIQNTQTSTGVLLSNGDGTFNASAFESTPYYPGAVAVADFNGDGNQDVVVLPIGQQLVVFAGDGAGNLIPGLVYGAGAGAWQNLVAADFLNDGKPGLAFANFDVGTFSVVENTTK